MPTEGDIGMYGGVRITVSDGEATDDLTFDVEVVATASGAATLSWTAPTENADGSPLTDLAGFKVYWGTSQGNYPNSTTISNPGVTTYMVDQLPPATWFFVATAYDSFGNESPFSSAASKTIL